MALAFAFLIWSLWPGIRQRFARRNARSAGAAGGPGDG